MPYLPQADRTEPWLIAVYDLDPQSPAELCYLIYTLAVRYDAKQGKHDWESKGKTWMAIEAAAMEFYRRVLEPHEDKAIERNGDITA